MNMVSSLGLVAGWVVVGVLMLVGLLGCFLPMLPGTALILAGAFVYQWWVAAPGAELSQWTLWGLCGVMGVSYLLDFVSALIGANRFGASKYGIVGGILGVVVGLFFGLPGLLVGPLAGVVCGELFSGKPTREALRAAMGSLVGNAAGILARVVAGVVMVVWFVVAVWR